MQPLTRQLLVFSIGSIAVICIASEIILIWLGHETSEALLSIASTATGALAGAMIPRAEEG